MLETLDDIDWNSLEHAYGTAEDVPDQLRQLLSQDPKVRSEVMWKIYGNVFHQGTRYPATPFVIPFLIELCESPEILDRGELLNYWGSLITGYFSIQERPVWGDGDTIYFYGEAQKDEEVEDPYSAALHEIYRNSLEGKELLFKLLTHADHSIRAGAVWVLACLPTLKDESIRHLQAQLQREENVWVRAAIAFALGELGDANSLQILLENEDEHPAARCMAACELARLAPKDELIGSLLEFIGNPIEGYEHVPGAGGPSPGDAAFSITYLPAEVRARAVPAICEQLEQARSFATMPLVEALLSAAFEPSEDRRTEFNDLQRRVLLGMLNTHELWSIGNLFFTFEEYGLPHDREECAKLLGVKVSDDEAFSELSIAVTYAEMGFLEEARDGFDKALKLDPAVFARAPKPDECWLYCAKAFAETDPTRAITAYDNASSINPKIGNRVGVTWALADLLNESSD